MPVNTFLLRSATAVILLMHSIPGMFNGGVHDFGTLYLDAAGFAPFGLMLAWLIKISHVISAACFLVNKYVRPAGIVTIFILVAGIVMVHGKEGWFVVGGGRNGVEFNFLLIFVILTILFPGGIRNRRIK